MMILRKLIQVLAFVLSVPFITYGFLGIIKAAGLDGFIENYLGAYKQPMVAVVFVVIGCCLLYGLNALAAKIR